MNHELALFEGVSAAVSRRELLGRSAIALGGMSGASLLDPTSVFARANAGPRPIPGGFDTSGKPVPKDPLVHVLIPGIGFEMATISNFTGVVAGSEVRGQAHGSDGSIWDFDTDMRFMKGTYVGLDGRRRKGAFGFV